MTRTDVERDCAFLREQAEALGDALRGAGDPADVATALTAHEASHETWVCLLARLEREGSSHLAADIETLYAFHGRVVESLERGLDGWFNPEAAFQIRTVLADRLADCTAMAVAALRRTNLTPQPL